MIDYLIKSTLCLGVLYLLFVCCFRHSRHYHTMRAVLLAAVVFSLLVPALNIQVARNTAPFVQQVAQQATEVSGQIEAALPAVSPVATPKATAVAAPIGFDWGRHAIGVCSEYVWCFG